MSDDLRIKLLVVDDEQSIRRLCMTIGSSLAYNCNEAESAETAMQRLETDPPDLVLTDLKLPQPIRRGTAEADQGGAAARGSGHHDRPRVDRIGRGRDEAGGVRLHRKAVPRGKDAAAAAAHGGEGAAGERECVPAGTREHGREPGRNHRHFLGDARCLADDFAA